LASSPAAPPGQPPASASSLATPPELHEREKRGRGREGEERSFRKTKKKGRGEKKEEKERETKKYLFIKNMISKLYCLLLNKIKIIII
jgi:hypothetical protein